MSEGLRAGQPTSNNYMVPSVKTAVRVLKYLKSKEHRRASLSEICKALEASKSSTFNILKTLLAADFVSYDEADKRYSLGMELLELGGVVADDLDMIALSRPFARELAGQIQETCIVARWVAGRFVVLLCEEPARDIRVTMAVGQHFRYVSGAFGKAYLAFADKGQVREILRDGTRLASTPHSITTIKEFEKDLARCRQSGYAEGYEEAVLGVNAIASPIFDRNGEVVLVLGVLGFASSLSPELMRLDGRIVREAASRISAALGGSRRLDEARPPAEARSPVLGRK